MDKDKEEIDVFTVGRGGKLEVLHYEPNWDRLDAFCIVEDEQCFSTSFTTIS